MSKDSQTWNSIDRTLWRDLRLLTERIHMYVFKLEEY